MSPTIRAAGTSDHECILELIRSNALEAGDVAQAPAGFLPAESTANMAEFLAPQPAEAH